MKSARLYPAFLGLAVLLFSGCGGGGAPVNTGPLSGSSATIQVQPQDQSVPMGLSATYTVSTSATNVQYQWSKNGSPIAGATSATYTTPATAFSDTGETFSVAVKYSSGTLNSRNALLTVTARAPKPGDLRFGQVDSTLTVNGYQAQASDLSALDCPIPGAGGMIETDTAAGGTPFYLGNNPCEARYFEYPLPTGTTGIGVAYAVLPLVDYPSALYPGTFWTRTPSPSDAGSVIQSARLSPDGFALSFTYNMNVTGFDMQYHTVAGSALQNAITQEGQHGRVVTAVSYDGSQATYFSYGWTGDPSTLYEAKVVFSTLENAANDATTLANQGYILTATDGASAYQGDNVVLIGTRAQGDTMPRPVMVGTVNYATPTGYPTDTTGPLMQQGYATVAVILQYSATTHDIISYQYVGER